MRIAALVLMALTLAAVGSASSGTAWAGDAVRDEASSTVEIRAEGDGLLIRSVNRRFEVVSLYLPGESERRILLLREEEDVLRSTVEEGPRRATVRVEASAVGPAAGSGVLWRFEQAGETGALVDLVPGHPAFQVTRHGCCGARDTLHTFSLVNGRKLFDATSPPAYLEVPNSRGVVRLAAVHAAWSVDDEETFGGRRDIAGAITYATAEGPLRRVLVTVRPPATVEEMMGDPRAMWLLDGARTPEVAATLWSADGRRDREAIGGVQLVVAFTPGHSVMIPIVADRLDLERATVSPTLALEAAPLPEAVKSCSCRPPRPLFPPAGERESD